MKRFFVRHRGPDEIKTCPWKGSRSLRGSFGLMRLCLLLCLVPGLQRASLNAGVPGTRESIRTRGRRFPHKRTPAPFSRALSPRAARTLSGLESDTAETRPTLTIHRVRPDQIEILVQGVSGGEYGISASHDLAHWIHGPIATADSVGEVRFESEVSVSNTFFRVFVAIPATPDADPPEVALGERLFLETRFAQFFAAHASGQYHEPLNLGDPVLDNISVLESSAPSPFRSQTMSCRACHMVDEFRDNRLGNRTYADFARRSPIPDRGDGRHFTVRNSPPMVNASLPRTGEFFLHFDGEFVDGISLVKAAFTGRNFGWKPGERAQAVAHIAKVIREDDGQGFLGPDFGGSYRRAFAGTDPEIPGDFRLPPAFRLDVDVSTDEQILEGIAALVNAYMESLRFNTNDSGEYEGAPYDLFLSKNQLPQKPDAGESDLQYGRRLKRLIEALAAPRYVGAEDGQFVTHTQAYRFGPLELAGLKTFLTETAEPTRPFGVGRCVICHAPPHFTDFAFHNTGEAQQEYDAIHGAGAFVTLPVPALDERNGNPDEFLPATARHPDARERFRSIPSSARPGYTDLGVWNLYANPDFPAVQSALDSLLSARLTGLAPDRRLEQTVALFKTPGLRDLGHSAPYLHTGRIDTLEEVLRAYRVASELTRAGRLRNGDAELREMRLNADDIQSLAAFLNALNMDYE